MMYRLLIATLTAPFLTGACTDTLVYGERTGLNIAIRSDAAEGQPLEVNTGFQRRVVGFVPPRNEQSGEAVTMVSAFNLKRQAGENPFDDKVTIESAFASGKAATKVGNNSESVQAIFNRPGITVSPKASDQTNTVKIMRWVGTDQARAKEYLAFLTQFGSDPEDTGNDLASTQKAASEPKNAALNAQFISLKQL